MQECDGYEVALLQRDCVRLWEFVRHIYGDGDPMVAVNIQEQETRYAELKQGDREFLSTFKLRFDNQVKANIGAGVADINEPKRALDFICKLDPKRYKSMLAKMRNSALSMEENAYPQSLSAAYRIASGWVDEERGFGGAESHSAFVFENSKMPAGEKPPTTTGTNDDKKKVQLKTKRASKVTCYVCGSSGHYAKTCSLRKEGPDSAMIADHTNENPPDDGEDYYDEAAYVTTQETVLFTRDDVLLDSQASVSVFCNGNLLSKIGVSPSQITLNGVQSGAPGIKISQEGVFRELGKVYFSPKTSANILSYAVMIDNGNHISYSQTSDSFTLSPKGGGEDFVFSRKSASGSNGRFYCCNVSGRVESAFIQTVDENKKSYTKREIAGASKAREMLIKMGYPAVKDAISTIQSGSNFDITSQDFQIADSIWGPDIGSLKGKTTKKATEPADMTTGKAIVQVEQTLAVDIMFVEGVPSLVGVSTPLDLTLAVSLTSFDTSKASRCAVVIKKGLLEIISTLRSRNFFVTTIMSDGEGSIGSIATELKMLGVEIDISGAGGHVSRVERRIRTIKERVRAHMNHKIPYTLTTLGIAMLVLFCVSRMNFQPSHSRSDGPSPRELFSGRRIDAKLDFRAGFGDYAVCTVPNTDNSMASRTEDCIVMLPTGNRTGTVKMLTLTTGRIVSRDQFKILPLPDSAIARLNDLARREGRGGSTSVTVRKIAEKITNDSPSFATAPTGETYDPIVQLNDEVQQEEGQQPHNEGNVEWTLEEPEMGVSGEADEPGDENESERTEERTVEPEQIQRRSVLDMFRNGTDHTQLTVRASEADEKFGGELGDHVMNITVKHALRTRGAEAEKVIMMELSQMIEKRVWRPVTVSSLSSMERNRIIRSQMFLKEKFLPTGEFEKLKARLVAGGDQQDKALYDDLSSPTVSTSAVLSVLSIAAHEKRYVSVVDITGAYLNAEIGKEVTVHMRLDQLISGLMTKLCPEYLRYLDHKGCIVVKLQRALYGCV